MTTMLRGVISILRRNWMETISQMSLSSTTIRENDLDSSPSPTGRKLSKLRKISQVTRRRSIRWKMRWKINQPLKTKSAGPGIKRRAALVFSQIKGRRGRRAGERGLLTTTDRYNSFV